MALSLIKQTQNGVSGSVTPNCLLYGYFVLNIVGDVTINAPTMAADGQLFCIRVNDASGGHAITWNAAYKNAVQLCTGGLGPDGQYTTVWFFDDDEALLIHDSYV